MRDSMSELSWMIAALSPNCVSMASFALSPESWPICSGVRVLFSAGNGSSGFTVAVAAAAAAEDDAAAMDAAISMPAAVSAAPAAAAAVASSATCASCAACWLAAPKPGGMPVLLEAGGESDAMPPSCACSARTHDRARRWCTHEEGGQKAPDVNGARGDRSSGDRNDEETEDVDHGLICRMKWLKVGSEIG
ncbi:hypothetical protein DFH09DRAFT_628882 [Mycena vulgaris]|nr:hypothetical protein DFH09DRAFT_628882 [Mycena vulgaris]